MDTQNTNMTHTLQALKNKGFMVKECDGGYLLVHPSRGKFDWQPDELLYRSVILTGDGKRALSIGWPKFFNQGEWPEHDQAIATDLEAGQAVVTHKHDGSLLIRSVLPDGTVLFRTRDTFDGGKFAEFARNVARAKYAVLLDPAFYPEGSLLCESVGAENQIVVRYEGEDDLVLLGAAEHGASVAEVRYIPYRELVPFAQASGLRLVERYDWAGGGVGAILDMVRDWDTAEGVVVRSHDGQTLLKVKSAWYFAQHALRWRQTYERIARFCVDGNIQTEDELTHALMKAGWDYEITVTAKQHFQTFAARRIENEQAKQAALAFVRAFDAEGGEFADERARRKAFAARVFGPQSGPEVKTLSVYIFQVYDNKLAHLDAKLLGRLLTR
jgi:hypothetical protein